MDLTSFNNYFGEETEVTKQLFRVPITPGSHIDFDKHLIGETLGSPSEINPTGTISSLGNSPVPSREDHVHKGLEQAGTVYMTARTTASSGRLLCHGAAVSRTTYAVLFSAIGTNFGVGDNSTTFNLPDYRDLFPVGASGTKPLGSVAAFAPSTSPTQNYLAINFEIATGV